jgi:type IV pilus assembly protein PilA
MMRKRMLRGFTIIEMMIVVAIIGIMAAIAIPAYQDYTIRTKVSELVLVASSFRTTVSERAQDIATLVSAGVGLTVVPSGKVSGGSVTDNGVITISGNPATIGVSLSVTLTPTATSAGNLTWVCSTAVPNFKYVPGECRH